MVRRATCSPRSRARPTKTKDITGGLPRVVELFEARQPEGRRGHHGDRRRRSRTAPIAKGMRKIIIDRRRRARPREYLMPRCAHVNVQEGERVRAGEPLIDGPINPHDILRDARREGAAALPGGRDPGGLPVCRASTINDKHIEVIVRQMMRWVKIEEVGDTEFLIDEQVDQLPVRRGERARHRGGRAARRIGPAAAARHHEGVALDRTRSSRRPPSRRRPGC